VNAEDIQLIVNELEVSKAKADRVLREYGGNVIAALQDLVRS